MKFRRYNTGKRSRIYNPTALKSRRKKADSEKMTDSEKIIEE